MSDLKKKFQSGETFADFLARPKKYPEFWEGVYRRATVPEDILERAKNLKQQWHFLVLSEDWCGDSINTLPLIARLVDQAPMIDMRIIGRDANADVMDNHLTNGGRSIPVIILLDSDFVERGWWGPRPAQLQRWVVETGLALSKEDRYREVRTWYARDHGRAVLSELLEMIERNAQSPMEV